LLYGGSSRLGKLIPPRATSLLVRRAGPLPPDGPAQVDTAVFRPRPEIAPLVLSEDGIHFSLYPVRSHSLRKILTPLPVLWTSCMDEKSCYRLLRFCVYQGGAHP
jgi:hypothetical protein